MNVWLAFYFITRGWCVAAPGLPWLKKYISLWCLVARINNIWGILLGLQAPQRFVSKFGIVDGSFLRILLRLYRFMYVQPLPLSIISLWNSLKLIHDQTHIEFLIYRYFRRKIYDSIEINRLYISYTKGARRPSFGAKRPPRCIAPS